MDKLRAGDPQRIGAYRLLARLGSGGMGQVYLARSDRGRTVAVKLVREELAAQEEFRDRFRQEVHAARRVGGTWTAPVLDADTEAPVPWVATGYVAGPSLQRVVGHDHGPLPERSVRILAAGLARALADIHAAGIVHRDLKPSNVLVTIDGPRVIDFGIARALETVAEGGYTRTGALVGSPGFMAPEQVRGDRVTPACDVFCLGSVLAFAATGRQPFGTDNGGVHALMFRIAQEEPDLEGLPEGLVDLVRDCLRKDPAQRPGLDAILARSGVADLVTDGRSRDPWLPAALVAQLGRHAVQLLETENPEEPEQEPSGAAAGPGGSGAASGTASGSGDGGGAGAVGPAGIGPASGPASGSGSGAGVGAGVPAGAGAGASPAGTGVPAGGAGETSSPALPYRPTVVPGTPGVPYPGPGVPGAPPGPGPQGGDPAHAPTQADSAPMPPARAVPASSGPAYGYPHPGPAHGQGVPPGAPAPYHGAPGATPPYGAAPAYPGGPDGHGAGPEPRRARRSTLALVAVAVVVALAAGGAVYAVMNRGGDGGASAGSPASSAPAQAPGPDGRSGAQASASPGESGQPGDDATGTAEGAVPSAYLGTWSSTIENAQGSHSRRLTIRNGSVGDTVLSLVADGPDYHCVFEAPLAEQPADGGPLRIGPSEVRVGRPASSCSPGAASEVRLLGDGTLERVNTGTGEKLVYTKQ